MSVSGLHVALLVATPDSYGRRVLDGILDYLRLHPHWNTEFDAWRDPHRVPDLSGYSGVIARVSTDEMGEQLQGCKLPIINVSASRYRMPQFPAVVPDNYAAGRMVGDHLLERGFEHMAFVGPNRPQFARDRWQGFRERSAESDCNVEVYWFTQNMGDDWLTEEHLEPLSQWLKERPQPLGVMASNDVVARAVVRACRKASLDVPDQVAVVGADDDEHLCELTTPSLSSVALGLERVGYRAAAFLDELIAGEAVPDQPIMLPPGELKVRRSSDVFALGDRKVVAALNLIRQRATQGLTVTEVASHVRLSRRALELRFRRETGRTPRDEIGRTRMETARKLLATNMSITQVAAEAGFSSQSRFGQMFRNETGMTPLQFRRSLRGDTISSPKS